MTDIKTSNIVVLIICMVIIVGSYIFIQFKDIQDEGKLLIKTLESSGATVGKININGWKRIKGNTSANATSTLEQMARSLYQNKPIPPFETRHFKHTTEITTNADISPGLKARLTLIETPTRTNVKNEHYLVLSLEGHSTLEVLKSMEKIYDNVIGEDGQKSVILSGFMEGNLSPPQEDNVIQKMVKTARVQKVEKLESGPLVSVTGYSPNVRDELTVTGKSVNINMALRYNSVQNRTLVYIGSPVITSEY